MVHIVRRLSEIPKDFPKKRSKKYNKGDRRSSNVPGPWISDKSGHENYIVSVENRINFKWLLKWETRYLNFIGRTKMKTLRQNVENQVTLNSLSKINAS